MIVLNTLLNGNTICDFLDPVDPVMCDTLEFISGFNRVRWICKNAESNTPMENDPYYYKQPVNTECEPSHM